MKIAAIVLSLASVCCTQTAQQGTPAEVPVDKEPHHHLVFENEYVRVFKVEVPPHESTLVHRHSRDYVVVTIGDADVTNAVVGKEPKRWNFRDGEVTFLEASGEKSFAHTAVNEGEKPFVNYTIELKRAPGRLICQGIDCSFQILSRGFPRYAFESMSVLQTSLQGSEMAEVPELVVARSHSGTGTRGGVKKKQTAPLFWRDKGQRISRLKMNAVELQFGAPRRRPSK